MVNILSLGTLVKPSVALKSIYQDSFQDNTHVNVVYKIGTILCRHQYGLELTSPSTPMDVTTTLPEIWIVSCRKDEAQYIPRIICTVHALMYYPYSSCLRHWRWGNREITHYSDVIMSSVASQITGVSVLYSTVWRRSKKTSKLRVTGNRWIPRTKGQ